MCRLFGMHAGAEEVGATFWLLDAPESLREQSFYQPDGSGLGYFLPDGTPEVDKRPIAAHEDELFAAEARTVVSNTFIAHLRFASTGAQRFRNTHPFVQCGRLFAHNGVFERLDRLEAALTPRFGELVHGDTDSERLFALISQHTDVLDGDLRAGIISAVQWCAHYLPVYALNMVIATVDELYALRYPAAHELWLLERPAGGSADESRTLDVAGSAGTVHVHADAPAQRPVVVVASERMDDNPDWTLLASGELMHVAPDLTVTRELVLPDDPVHLLTIEELREQAARSQTVAPP